jgi:hypothetical protein
MRKTLAYQGFSLVAGLIGGQRCTPVCCVLLSAVSCRVLCDAVCCVMPCAVCCRVLCAAVSCTLNGMGRVCYVLWVLWVGGMHAE